MPLPRKSVELVEDETPEWMEKMERGLFYAFDEIYELAYGWIPKKEPAQVRKLVPWFNTITVAKLESLLALLVSQKKLFTAVQIGEPQFIEIDGKPIRVDGQKIPNAPEIYYGLRGSS